MATKKEQEEAAAKAAAEEAKTAEAETTAAEEAVAEASDTAVQMTAEEAEALAFVTEHGRPPAGWSFTPNRVPPVHRNEEA